jgi:hypothetical protein
MEGMFVLSFHCECFFKYLKIGYRKPNIEQVYLHVLHVKIDKF